MLNTADLIISAGKATKHAIMRTISVICVLLVIAGICWAVYSAFIKPTTNPNETTSQNAEEIINNTNAPSAGMLGCASLKVMNYYKAQKPVEIKK